MDKKINLEKKWVKIFFISLILILVFIISLNVIVDPIGIFGDNFFNWYSYDFTNNPRASKTAYLDNHFMEYDSYIIGCSSTSSFSPATLNKYYNSTFYNLIMYGADMLDVEQTCNYLIENYHPKRKIKNIIVNLHLSNGTKYDEELNNITNNLHANVNGESKIKFYGRYLLLNPRYAFAKIDSKFKDTYITQTFDVFDIKTGAYDKKVRDAEPIGSLEEYYANYPAFLNYPQYDEPMTKIDETMSSLANIKNICEKNNINFVVTTSPTYIDHLKHYNREDVNTFFEKMANVTDFWDFTTNSLCKDPRYFYDETHFRNSVGDMAIARIFENKNVYYPDDLGFLVTKQNVSKHLKDLWEYVDSADYNNDLSEFEKSYTKNIPILTYHHIKESANDNTTITAEQFENHLKILKKNNYNTIQISDLIKYVYNGIELPSNPILITFDDGYYSNYEYAFPLLKKYDMKATIFVIGISVGKDTYKNTNNPITPHFGYDKAKEMQDSRNYRIRKSYI